MSVPHGRESLRSLLLLRTTRGLLTAPLYRALVGGIGLAYGFVAMMVGGMLELSPSGGATPPFLWIVPRRPGMAWYFPAILAGGPHFLLFLPIVSTLLMVLTAAGVGLGMSAGIRVAATVLRPAFSRRTGPPLSASVMGLTPALLAFVTLGACCSTTAAASAGIVALAQASGTSTTAVLVNTWYLGLFQVVVVYIALIAQEQLAVVYGRFFGTGPLNSKSLPNRDALPRRIGAAFLRLLLVSSGLLWALSALTVWFSVPLTDTPPTVWFGVVFQHLLPGSLAVLVGLAPNVIAGILGPSSKFWTDKPTRGIALVSAALNLAWLPPSLASHGAPGLVNELGSRFGLPAGWGAVSPPFTDPWLVGLRWVFGFATVGGIALWLAVRPGPTLRLLRADLPSRRGDGRRRAVMAGSDAADPG